MPAAVPGFASRLFLSGACAFILIGMASGLYGVALPFYTRTFDLPEGAAGALLSAHGAGALTSVGAGIFGLRPFGARSALALLALGAALLAWQPSWAVVLTGAAVLGLGFGLISAIVNRAFLTGFAEKGPGMTGLVNALYGVGAIVAPAVFLLLGSQPALVWTGVAAVALVIWTIARVLNGGAATPPGLPNLLQKRVLVLGFNFVSVVIEVAVAGLGPSALIVAGYPEATAAALTSGFFLSFLAGRGSLYWLTRLIPVDLLYVIGLGGSALAMGLAAVGLPAVGFVLSGAFIGICFPAYYVWANGVLGNDPRMGSAVLTSGLIGAAVGPALLRPVLEVQGYGVVWAICALLALLALLAFAMVLRPARNLVLRQRSA